MYDDTIDPSVSPEGRVAPQAAPPGPIVPDEALRAAEAAQGPRPPRQWSGRAVVLAAIAGAVIGALVFSAGLLWLYATLNADAVEEPAGTAGTTSTITIDASEQYGVAEAVALKVTPSVVSVIIEATGADPYTGRMVTQQVGNGSGVIIREDGYILTNDHVVEGADALVVTLGVEDVPATVVGRDPSSDLAVIKVERTGLPAAELGSSADLKVGEPVVAIGSPFGLDQTVTSGIVSALSRSSLMEGQTDITVYTNLIQTDAAINPGNSGGALCNAQGQVIGINTLIQSPSGEIGATQSAGIGFAIPIDYAKGVADELIAKGTVDHAYMGVGTVTVDASVAAEYGLSVDSGAIVQYVDPGSPAEAAGIERGDIIVSIDGESIEGTTDVFIGVRAHGVGDTVSVVVVRETERLTLEVTLGSDASQ